MSTRAERHTRRKRIVESMGKTPYLIQIPESDYLAKLLKEEVDYGFISNVLNDEPLSRQDVTEGEVQEILNALDKSFNSQKYDVLFQSSKEVLIDQLLAPMHLSREDLEGSDRDFNYRREDYTRSGKGVGGTNKSFETIREQEKAKATDPNGQIRDVNTGKQIDASQADLDHIKPLKNIHDDGGFMLNDKEKAAAGTDTDNMEFTHSSINRSKGAKGQDEFANSEENKSKHELDGRRTKPAHERGEKAFEKHVNKKTIAKNMAKDGLNTGANQGLQQAMGVLLSEFISAVFSEVKDALENGFKGGEYNLTWTDALSKRLINVKNKLITKWENVAKAFATGALSGFLSAITTALINFLIRTGKNAVRLIREGFLSLFKALKTLLFPPEGLTLKEAAHEATKVFATGVVVTGGILANEAISQFLSTIPFGDVISTVITGLITGLGSLLVVFLLDKLDLFGVNRDNRHKFIIGELDKSITQKVDKIEAMLREIDERDILFC